MSTFNILAGGTERKLISIGFTGAMKKVMITLINIIKGNSANINWAPFAEAFENFGFTVVYDRNLAILITALFAALAKDQNMRGDGRKVINKAVASSTDSNREITLGQALIEGDGKAIHKILSHLKFREILMEMGISEKYIRQFLNRVKKITPWRLSGSKNVLEVIKTTFEDMTFMEYSIQTEKELLKKEVSDVQALWSDMKRAIRHVKQVDAKERLDAVKMALKKVDELQLLILKAQEKLKAQKTDDDLETMMGDIEYIEKSMPAEIKKIEVVAVKKSKKTDSDITAGTKKLVKEARTVLSRTLEVIRTLKKVPAPTKEQVIKSAEELYFEALDVMQMARDSREGLIDTLNRLLVLSKSGTLAEVISALDDLKISVISEKEAIEATKVEEVRERVTKAAKIAIEATKVEKVIERVTQAKNTVIEESEKAAAAAKAAVAAATVAIEKISEIEVEGVVSAIENVILEEAKEVLAIAKATEAEVGIASVAIVGKYETPQPLPTEHPSPHPEEGKG